jgi:hypothetical protein
VLPVRGEIDERIGEIVELGQFVLALVELASEIVAGGSAAGAFVDGGLDLGGVVVSGLPGTAGVSGVSGGGAEEAGEDGGGVTDPRGDESFGHGESSEGLSVHMHNNQRLSPSAVNLSAHVFAKSGTIPANVL